MSNLATYLSAGTHWGVFGGGFDPPHIGHIALAKSLRDSANLDGVIFVPSFHPPHKSQSKTSFADRMAMCELACDTDNNNDSSLIVSDVESKLQSPNYTVEVIEYLKQTFPEVRLSVLIGADNLEILGSWHRIEDLLRLAGLIVGSRPQYEQKLQSDIENTIPEEIRNKIQIVQSTLIDISSTTLRDYRRDNPDANHSELHPKVAQYIQDHKLYKSR